VETWEVVLAVGVPLLGLCGWLAWSAWKLLLMAQDVAECYIGAQADALRRAVLLMLVRAAEELMGPDRGPEKHNYVQGAGDELGYDFSDDEVAAAAREATKERAVRRDDIPPNTQAPP